MDTTIPAPQRLARLTGLAYLGIIVTGIFAEFVVRMSLVVPGDAATTTANIADSAGLFRAGIVADLAMIALDIGVAVGLYALLRHVHRPLAMAAAAFRLIQAAVLGANLMNMANALQLATGGAAMGPATTRSLTLASMELHSVVYDLALVFFGIACLVLGHLLTVSRLVPRLLGRGLMVTGMVYLVGTTAIVLAPEVAATLDPMYGIAVVAELAIAGWLTFKGVTTTATSRTPELATA
jgi:hypothetical protein